MRDVDILVKVIQQIDLILAEHVEPGTFSDPADIVDRIFAVMDKNGAVDAAVPPSATRA